MFMYQVWSCCNAKTIIYWPGWQLGRRRTQGRLSLGLWLFISLLPFPSQVTSHLWSHSAYGFTKRLKLQKQNVWNQCAAPQHLTMSCWRSNQHSTSCRFQIKQKTVVVRKSERIGQQSTEKKHGTHKTPLQQKCLELGRCYFMHWVLYVCACFGCWGGGGCTKQLKEEKNHTGNKKKLIKCVSEIDKLRTKRGQREREREQNNFTSVNGFFEEMKSAHCWGLVNVEARQGGAEVEYAFRNGYEEPGNICLILISPTPQMLPHYPSLPSYVYTKHSKK